MALKEVKGILLDADYANRQEKSIVRLFVRTQNGIEAFEDASFRPYFFAAVDNAEKAERAIGGAVFSDGSRALSVEKAEIAGKGKVLKIVFAKVQDLVAARKDISGFQGVLELFEHDIPFAKRYILDKGLEPMNGITLSVEGSEIKKAIPFDSEPGFRAMAFDLETLSPGRFSDPKKDPILMVSAGLGGKTIVLSHGKAGERGLKQGIGKAGENQGAGKGALANAKGKQGRGQGGLASAEAPVEFFSDEAGMIRGFAGLLERQDPDIIATYNGDLFDWPYLKARCEKLGVPLPVSADGSEPKVLRKGRDNAVKLKGRQHLDVYQMLRFLSRFSVVNLIKFDLESVVASLYGIEKEKIVSDEINSIWESGNGLGRLASYCAEDSAYTLRIAQDYLPLLVELCKIVKQPLFEVGRASASMLVEYLIMQKCRETKRLIANKPDDTEITQRMMHPIKGGYVKEPEPGLHGNLAVLDFSSLYPTIIISHNVSPDTIGCDHEECKEKNPSPNRQWFCSREKGLVPEILKGLFERRMEIKKKAKAVERGSGEFRILNARQRALKILLNSFYGYLGYSRSRFYCRECASAITAWARNYVKWVGREAEKAGFKVIYSDTDSAFLVVPDGKSRQDVEDFVKGINSQLPGVMNLELEGFFKRGIFVTKESGEGAKKKYALIDYEGNLKIVGFEYVRRDWAGIAKETQRQVIAAILAEGKPEKAVSIIREKIEMLKSGKARNSELVVLTQIKRRLDKYEAIGPHVAASIKAVARGREIGPGSVVSYIITKSGKSISDKARLQEFVNEGNYDADYYIEHQVVPAVIKVMRELGYTREDLVQGGKQHKLASFF